MRVLEISGPQELKQIMQDIGVDPYGIKIMLPKAVSHLVKLNSVSNIAANILKQEMLSIGADATVSQWTVDCSKPKTDVLLMGTLKHYKHLIVKMRQQGAARPTAEKKDEYKAVADELSALLKKDLSP